MEVLKCNMTWAEKSTRISGIYAVCCAERCSVFGINPAIPPFVHSTCNPTDAKGFTETQNYPMKKQLFYLRYPYICIHILWNILTFKILDIVNTNIPKSMYIVIYVQGNRTFPKLFSAFICYTIWSRYCTVNKYGLFHSFISFSVPWAKMY